MTSDQIRIAESMICTLVSLAIAAAIRPFDAKIEAAEAKVRETPGVDSKKLAEFVRERHLSGSDQSTIYHEDFVSEKGKRKREEAQEALNEVKTEKVNAEKEAREAAENGANDIRLALVSGAEAYQTAVNQFKSNFGLNDAPAAG